MNGTMMHDSASRPELFTWHGHISAEQLDEWLETRRLRIPCDLHQLWQETGGGEIFESETILSPLGEEELGDDVDSVNRLHRDRGLAPGYLIFHVGGAGISAVRLADQHFVLMSEDGYTEEVEFRSLEEWYCSAIRSEYARRYGFNEGAGTR